MNKNNKEGVARLLQIAGYKKKLLIFSSLLSILHGILNLTPYLIIYAILFDITEQIFSLAKLQSYVIYGVGVMICSYLLFYVSLVSSHLAAFDIIYDFRKAIAQKLGKLSLGYLHNKQSGSIKKILIDDIEKLEGFIAHNLPDVVKSIMMPLIILCFMFYLDYRLAFASLIPLFVFLIWITFMIKSSHMKEIVKKYYDSSEHMDGVIVEYVKAINIMKVFNQEAKTFENYKSAIDSYTLQVIYFIKKNTPFFAILISFISNALLPILAIGLYLYFTQQVSLSTFLLFLILGVSYLKPILSLSTLANNMYSVMEGIKRVDTILEDKNQILDSKKKVNLKNYNIKFTNVSFAYDKQEVLKNINLDIPQGKITAFIGVSGAGKSTACELLARFYDVSQGKIEIGEHNIKDIDFSQLMNTVSYVFQDNFMFNDSLLNNITMGRNITKQKVINAAKIANIDSYINSLSAGYDTKYGEDGVVLSGGQKQKIQLARIILKDASIFILDEATSFFDAKNEYEIQKSINKLIVNKTVIVVAHRLSTIVNCDNIVLWDNGKIIAMGTHENLLKNCSKYQNMLEKRVS